VGTELVSRVPEQVMTSAHQRRDASEELGGFAAPQSVTVMRAAFVVDPPLMDRCGSGIETVHPFRRSSSHRLRFSASIPRACC
jgi:hypothetical protein